MSMNQASNVTGLDGECYNIRWLLSQYQAVDSTVSGG